MKFLFSSTRDCILALATTAIGVSVMSVLRIEPHFAHMCGYTTGLAVFFALLHKRNKPNHFAVTAETAGVLAGSYALSLVSLSFLISQTDFPVFVSQGCALAVFIVCVAAGGVAFDRLQKFCIIVAGQLTANLIAGLLFVSIVALVASNIWAANTFERSIDYRASLAVSNRVATWLRVAECYNESGKILSVCTNSTRVEPVESAFVADDRGHAVILSLLSRWLGAPIEMRTLVIINFAIIIIGIWLLAIQVFRLGYRIAGVLLAASALPIANLGVVTADAPGAYLGLFALSLFMPLQLLHMLLGRRLTFADWLYFVFAVVALAFVSLVREPFGIMAAIVSIAALVGGVIFRKRGNATSLVICVAALLSVVIANKSTLLIVEYREAFQGVAQSEGGLTHGIAHNLYLGLGSEPNSFGIEYDDNFGVEAVRRYDPTIKYGTKKYYDTIRNLYFEVVFAHPAEVAWIYMAKFGKAFGLFVVPILAGSLAMLVFAKSLAGKDAVGASRASPYIVIVQISLLVLLNTLQGVLTTPSGNNFPSIVGFLALIALVVDVWMFSMLLRNRRLSEASVRWLFPRAGSF